MRLNLSNQPQPLSLRKGVTASVMSKKRSVQSPVARVMNSAGLAPSHSGKTTTPATSRASGSSASTNTAILSAVSFAGLSCMAREPRANRPPPSEKFLQVHAGVQLRHLVAVAVEQLRLL